MKKVMVYIDGFNLHYGMLKGTLYKWLDLEKFVNAIPVGTHGNVIRRPDGWK